MTREEAFEKAMVMRADALKLYNYYRDYPKRCEEMHVTGRDGHAIRVLLFRAPQPNAPVIFDMHGGGFIMNDVDLDEPFCHLLQTQLGATVVSINYRKAPEHPFPAALHDVYDVVRYFVDNAEAYGIDTRRMAIGGHSAGGNLAAAMCILSKGDFAFRCHYVDCPVTDVKQDPYEKFTPPEAIQPEADLVFNLCYCDPAEAENPLVSPALADRETLSGMPAAIILTAELDSLRDEAERYGRKLIEANVPVYMRRFPKATHCFPLYFGTEDSQKGCSMLLSALRMFLA